MKRSIPILLALFGAVLAGDSLENEYFKQAAAIKSGDADAHYRLALWCKANGMAAYANREHRAVVTLDTDHRASRRALGYEQVHGRWAKGKDLMRLKGFKEVDGRWVTPEEYKLYAKDEIAAQKAKEARKTSDAALKKAWNKDATVRGRAMAEIERLDKAHRLRPLSIAARIKYPDVRLRAVKGLGGLDNPDALKPLYKRAIFDKSEGIRKAAVAAIKNANVPAKGKSDPFIRALNSPFDPVRVHAIEALGALGDERAVGPLVARFQVIGGSGQSVYISTVNQIAYVQDFDVEVAQTAFIADPVIGVIQDGLTLNFRALATSGYIDVYEKPALAGALGSLTGKNLGEDPKAWMKWYRNEQRAKLERRKAEREADS
jgi:HEAT repeat protein